MPDPVLAVMEEAGVRQEFGRGSLIIRLRMEPHRVPGDGLQADAADGRTVRAEILAQQAFIQADALEYPGAPIGADGGNAHLGHDLQQALLHRLDIIGARRGIVQLHLAAVCQARDNCEGKIWVDGGGAVAEQQRGMHRLTNLPALDDQRRLDPLASGNQVMVHGADSQQRRDGRMGLVHVAIRQNDVVHPVIDAFLRLAAEVGQGPAQVGRRRGGTFRAFEQDRQLDGVEALVTDVAEQVELRVGQDRMRQAHHLAVVLIRRQDARADPSDILEEGHHHLLADGVDGRVGHLGELLAEIVEERLRTFCQNSQRRVISH